MNSRNIRFGLGVLAIIIGTTGCDFINLLKETPTKVAMEGIWEVTEAYDENNVSILDQINFPVTAFQLSSDNSVISTAGPMITSIVYGKSKYTEVASKIDQVFKYTGLNFTNGEWFCEDGNVSRFTLEMKLEGLPGQKSLTDLLSWVGITNVSYLKTVVYHKFLDVSVTFEPLNDSVMTWQFDDITSARYNMKDAYGDYKLWEGWPVTAFGHFTFVLTKRVKTLKELITDPAN